MELTKVQKVEAYTTDGKLMQEGKTYVFHAGDRDVIAVFEGIVKRGYLAFRNVTKQNADAPYHVAPSAVIVIFEASVS